MILFLNFWCFSIMVFDFTPWSVDGRPGNEYFSIPHKICDLMTPLTPLGVRPQCLQMISLKIKFETDWTNSSQCDFILQNIYPWFMLKIRRRIPPTDRIFCHIIYKVSSKWHSDACTNIWLHKDFSIVIFYYHSILKLQILSMQICRL